MQGEHDGLEEDRSDPRGVEPTAGPPRREVERGRGSTNELAQDVRAVVGRPRSRAVRPWVPPSWHLRRSR